MKPKCRKCKKRLCQYYGSVGGFSVQCKKCNEAQGEKRRAAADARKALKATCPACKSTKIAMCFGRNGHGWKCTDCNSWLVREDY